ncbi:pyridoxine/pyridoxamine 5'-phosphate oxidase [Nocardiopsis lucentensis]|uniref:pyridoxine/pyridoxamine 5'-phosphate oxidase n=1 Tax=Nocardiopsis lucentensis TaxID=53441 RepID=UPI00034AA23B|nr:pyridoxal 5'-phosphate synthase [Nocardiopsis lucentensis]
MSEHGDAHGGIRELLRGLPVFAGPIAEFDPSTAPEDPARLFTDWFAEAVAAGVREPHAMTVATVNERGEPSSRVVIMKDFTLEGWWFATTTGSRKGRDLARNPAVALSFYWGEQGRQIRVRGFAELADPDRCAADYLARPLESRVAGLHGRQSEPLTDLTDIHRAADESRARLEADPDLVPSDWGLYRVAATEIEFWQADRDRRHTRLRYTRPTVDSGWDRELLWP